MRGNVEVEDTPAIVSEHDEDEQDAQARGRNGEEIEGDQIRDVIGKERAPGLRGGCAALRPGRRSLVDGELLVQGEVFEGELAVAAAKKGQEAKQLEQEGDHRTRIFAGSEPADQPLPAGLNFGEGQGSPRCHLVLADERGEAWRITLAVREIVWANPLEAPARPAEAPLIGAAGPRWDRLPA